VPEGGFGGLWGLLCKGGVMIDGVVSGRSEGL